MTREATTDLLQEAATRFGTEPINIVMIEWDDVTIYYGDKAIVIGTINVIGSILDFSTLSSQIKSQGSGDFSSVNIVLDDSDNDLKERVNTQLLESRSATVYQYFENLAEADLMVLLKGRISGDIEWSEANRTLRFDVEHYIEDNEIGFAPTEEEIPDISKDAIEKAWPLCFGTVLKVPTVHVLRPPNGALQENWTNDQVFGLETEVDIERGEDFPQDVLIDVMIGNLKVRGTMDGNLFTVSEANLPTNSALAIIDRPENDVHTQDARVIWIEDSSIKIVGQYCYLLYLREGSDPFYIVNYCISQYGNKCYFKKPWQIIIQYPSPGVGADATYEGLNILIGSETSPIIETAGIPRESWEDTYWSRTGGIYEPGSPNSTAFPTLETFPAWQRFGVLKDKWLAKPGTFVRQITGYNDLYIANLIPSSSILEVYAKRTYRGEEIFVPIPISYYTKILNYSIAGQNATVIELPKSLLSFVGENWDEGIYVSLRSSVGPNVSNIIKWLIETYSNLEVDTESFEIVRQLVDKFWANFALFKQPNVLSICEDIARQARCAILIGNGEIKIKYLSQVPISIQTITRDLTQLKSLQLGFSTLDDVITKTKNTWLFDYSDREEYEKYYVYKNNIDTFGLIDEEEEFFIYNIELFIKISAGFWGYRSSNVWRKASLGTFLNLLNAEAFDAVTLSIPEVSTNEILSDIEVQSHDSDYAPNINLELTMGSKSGESGDGQPIQDDNYWLGDPNYPANMTIPNDLDPGQGRREVEYTVPTDLEGNTGGDEEEEEVVNPYVLVFITTPVSVIRGTAFVVTIYIIDKNGETVNIDKTGQLVLQSNDDDDRLGTGGPSTVTSISINFVSGKYSSSALQITDGAGIDTGLFVLTMVDFDETRSDTFEIIDPPVGALVWTPTSFDTQRVANFPIALSGGAPNQSVDCEFATIDGRDGLYVGGVQLPLNGKRFSLTLDGAGEYSSTVWSIRGGYIDGASGYLKASDPNKLLSSAICEPIRVFGDSPAKFEQSFGMSQELIANGIGLEIEHVGAAGIDIPFELTITVVDEAGNPLIDAEGIILLTAVDGNDEVINWVDIGPDGNNRTTEVDVFIDEGTWTYANVLWTITEDNVTPATITAVLILPDEQIIIVDYNVPIGLAHFVVSSVVEVSRGIPFQLGVQAMLGTGAYDLLYVPTIPLDITLVSSDIDTILPITIPITGWVNGYKQIDVVVSDGAGSDVGTIFVNDSVLGLVGNQGITIDSIVVVENALEKKIYDGSGFYIATFEGPDPEDWSPLDCASAADAQFIQTAYESLIDFRADSILGTPTGFSGEMYRTITDTHDYARFNCDYRFGFYRFSISPAERLGAISASIRVKAYHRQSYGLPTRLYRASPFAGSYTMKVGITEAVDYSNGAEVENMVNPELFSFAYINQLQIEAGWDGQHFVTAQLIDIPIPISWIEDMVSSNLYVWIFVEGATPYNCGLYQGQSSPERRSGEEQIIDNLSIRIQK